MLKRAFIYSSAFLVLFISLVLVNLLMINKKDVEEFKKIILKNKEELRYQNAYQKRQNVKKDLYFIEDNKRKHFVLFSKSSNIFLNKKTKKFSLIEKLNDIEFLSFDSIVKNQLSHIKYVKAKDGIYFFPNHKFELNDLDICFFNAFPTIDIKTLDIKNAFFEGTASRLTLSLLEKKPKILADDFVGTFYPKKGIQCEK